MAAGNIIDWAKVSYQPMTPDYIEQVLEIESQISVSPWSRRNFESSLDSHNQCRILLQNNTLAGYAVLSNVAGEAELLIIGVAKEYQGLGLGRQLLLHMLSCAKKVGANAVFLEVRASNEVAQNLYASEGFNEVGVRPAYYPAPQGREDAVIMALEF